MNRADRRAAAHEATPPHRTPLDVRYGVVLGLLLTALLPACRHAPNHGTAWQSVAVSTPPPPLVLEEASLDAPGVITALHETLVALEGRKSAARLLLGAAVSWNDDALAASAAARRVVIHAVFHAVQAGVLGQQFAQVRDVVDRMVRTAPKAAETRFALAYLRWILVADGAGALKRRGLSEAVLRDLLQNLDALATQHPTFDGPGDFDRARIRRERDAVRALLAASDRGAPGARAPQAGLPAPATAATR